MPCFPLYPYRLTAFVTKCFGQAQEFIFIDDKNIQDALKWMAGNQLPSDCYANVGKLIHTAMKVRICHQCVREELVALTEQNPKSSGLGADVTQVSALDRVPWSRYLASLSLSIHVYTVTLCARSWFSKCGPRPIASATPESLFPRQIPAPAPALL